MEILAGRLEAPRFPPDLDWINCRAPLDWGKLRGHLVILEFWTFG
jgi:hypothetical protein